MLLAELFGHHLPAPIIFAPIGINKLYHTQGELVPAKIAGELGLPVCAIKLAWTCLSVLMHSQKYCLSTAGSQSIEDVAKANEEGASEKNESNGTYSFKGHREGNATSPRFFQLYMGHDDDVVSMSAMRRLNGASCTFTDHQSAGTGLEKRV